MLAAIGMLLMGLIDKIFITKFVSLEILGKYTILISLLSYFTLSITIVSNVLLSNYLKIWEENKSFVGEENQYNLFLPINPINYWQHCF